MQKERRKYERYSIKIPAQIKDVDDKAIVKDISVGGIAVKTIADWEKDSHKEIVFLIEGQNVRCSGYIRVKLQKEEGFIYGIEFAKDKLKTTQKLVEHREKIESLEFI